MRAHSERFARAVTTSHRIAVRADVLFNRQVIISGLPVIAGEITYDRTAAVMARCTATIACTRTDVPSLLPTADTGGPLAPYGYEVQFWRGIRFGDGTEELLPMMVGPIQHASLDAVTLLFEVDVFDRSQEFRDARLETDYLCPAGINLGFYVQSLLADRVPSADFAFAELAAVTTEQVIPAQSDPWAFSQRVLRDVGMDLFHDGLGRCVARAEPGENREPVATIADGPGGTLTGLKVELDREHTYNKVIVRSENSSLGTISRGIATDLDPASPTLYGGPFGKKPMFHSSPILTTDAQAAIAAQTRLAAVDGLARGLSFTMVPNPALEPGDVLRVRCSNLDLDELHILDSFTIGLAADTEMGAG